MTSRRPRGNRLRLARRRDVHGRSRAAPWGARGEAAGRLSRRSWRNSVASHQRPYRLPWRLARWRRWSRCCHRPQGLLRWQLARRRGRGRARLRMPRCCRSSRPRWPLCVEREVEQIILRRSRHRSDAPAVSAAAAGSQRAAHHSLPCLPDLEGGLHIFGTGLCALRPSQAQEPHSSTRARPRRVVCSRASGTVHHVDQTWRHHGCVPLHGFSEASLSC